MDQNNIIDAGGAYQQVPAVQPTVGSCYSNGWDKMWHYFLELLLIVVIQILIALPAGGMSVFQEDSGAGDFFVGIFSTAYAIFIQWPVAYGVLYAFLKAARNEKVEVKDMFYSFNNYFNVILAHLITSVIIIIGLVLLVVPGIIFACRLAFVPFLVVEEKMEAIEAVKKSWNMTKGHAFTVFLIGLLAFFIAIAGLIVFVVGVLAAIIWIELAFATLYYAVKLKSASKPAEI